MVGLASLFVSEVLKVLIDIKMNIFIFNQTLMKATRPDPLSRLHGAVRPTIFKSIGLSESGVMGNIFKRYDLNESSTYVLPEVDFDGKSQRVIYTLYEYTELIDSSNMDHHDYRQMAADILNGYDFFDGFVILHGTDTMVETAKSLEDIKDKTIVLMGAMQPARFKKTDAKSMIPFFRQNDAIFM